MTPSDLGGAGPLLLMVAGASVVASAGAVLRTHDRTLLWAGIAFALAAALCASLGGVGGDAFGGALRRDSASALFSVAISVSVAAALLLAIDRATLTPERAALLLLSSSGALAMAVAGDLIVLLFGLVTLTVPLYALSGLLVPAERTRPRVGTILATGMIPVLALGGALLVFAETGSLAVGALAAAASPSGRAGVAALIAAIGAAAVFAPFHIWSERTYAAAPVAVVAQAIVVVKLAAFAIALEIGRAMSAASPAAAADWTASLAVFAAALLAVGTLATLREPSLKRILTYSSVAQTGFVASAVAGAFAGSPAAALSLVVFAALTLGACGVLAVLPSGDPRVDDLSGLARSEPWLTVGFGTILLGLAGLPPTAGFIAKVAVFEAAADAALAWLVILGALASVVLAIAYLRVLRGCFEHGRGEGRRFGMAGAVSATVALGVVLAGLAPAGLLAIVANPRF